LKKLWAASTHEPAVLKKSADFSESQRTFQKVSRLFRKSADFSESQQTFQKVSGLFRKSADFSESQRTFQKVSGLFRKSADFSESQRTFQKVSRLFRKSADFSESQRTFQKVSGLFRKSADFSESQQTFQKVSGLSKSRLNFSKVRRIGLASRRNYGCALLLRFRAIGLSQNRRILVSFAGFPGNWGLTKISSGDPCPTLTLPGENPAVQQEHAQNRHSFAELSSLMSEIQELRLRVSLSPHLHPLLAFLINYRDHVAINYRDHAQREWVKKCQQQQNKNRLKRSSI
jgi:hypothetical protein